MKRVLFFTSNRSSYALKRYEEESKKRKYKFEIIEYQHLSLEFNKKLSFKYLNKKIDFNKNDIAILRGTSRFGVDDDNVLLNILANHISILKIKSPNLNSFLSYPNMDDKLFQYYVLLQNNFPVIAPTYYLNSSRVLFNRIRDIKYPLVLKPRNGSHGNNIHKIENKEEFFEMEYYYSVKKSLIQKCILNDFDLRIICTPNKLIGAMKRSARRGNFVNNYSAGGSVENYNLKDAKIIRDCLCMCKLFECDYMGIDLILREGKYYILEVTRFCQFEGFEKATSVNFPKEVFNLLEQRRQA